MNRILVSGMVVCALLVWHKDRSPLADDDQSSQPAKWERVIFRSEAGKEEAVMVLRIWDSAARDSKWPQLALLRLPPTVYNDFSKDSKTLETFIDGTKTGKPIFNADVTITEGCKLFRADGEKSSPEISWLVVVDHRQSHCSCTALREEANP
jgi:hypothetical protein